MLLSSSCHSTECNSAECHLDDCYVAVDVTFLKLTSGTNDDVKGLLTISYNFVKLFVAVINKRNLQMYKARVFVPGRTYQPSLLCLQVRQ